MHYAVSVVLPPRANAFILVAWLTACGHAQPATNASANESLAIGVAIDPSLSRLHIEECRGSSPCREYAVSTTRRTGSVARDPLRLGQTLLVPTSYMLGRVRNATRLRRAELDVHTSAGVAVSLPFAERDGRYELSARDFRFDGFAVLGRFAEIETEAVGTSLSIVLPEEATEFDHDMIAAWISDATETVGKLMGTFPVSRAQIIVVSVPRAGTVVPFGMAFRAGGASVLLFVSSDATSEALAADWVAVHELTHLTLPYVQEADAWFAEGYATYYQEVLRSISGARTNASVREAIGAAFARARNAGTGRTLADETRERHATHAYTRVYWGGAAIMMLADIAYHEHGCGSLREAVRRAAFTLDDMSRVFRANEVIERLDRACGVNALASARDRWLPSSAFPDVDPNNAAAMH